MSLAGSTGATKERLGASLERDARRKRDECIKSAIVLTPCVTPASDNRATNKSCARRPYAYTRMIARRWMHEKSSGVSARFLEDKAVASRAQIDKHSSGRKHLSETDNVLFVRKHKGFSSSPRIEMSGYSRISELKL